MFNELKGTLICTNTCMYKDDSDIEYTIHPGDEVKCVITDYGIRFEYKEDHYTQLFQSSIVALYYKMKA